MYEIFEHTADVGLRVRAPDLNALFADAGRGFCSLLVANPEAVRLDQEKAFRVAGNRYDDLLFDWLDELLYTWEAERLLLADFDVRVGANGLEGVGRGEPVDPQRHQLESEIKAVTYHRLRVERLGEGWLAEVILDL